MSRFTLGKDDKEGSLYDLFAVANHSGTVNFGHYTAFGRLAEADQPIDGLKKDGLGMYYSLFAFLCFDDDVVCLGYRWHMISSALWNIYAGVNPNEPVGKIDKFFYLLSCTRKIMWLLTNDIYKRQFLSNSGVRLLQVY